MLSDGNQMIQLASFLCWDSAIKHGVGAILYFLWWNTTNLLPILSWILNRDINNDLKESKDQK